jgi:hypothetical protein
MMSKKIQKLNLSLEAIIKNPFGLYEVHTLINGKPYTFPITSEFAVRKIQSLLRRNKPGKALSLLRLFKTSGFNAFEKEAQPCN